MADILVYVECRDGNPVKAATQVLSEAKRFAGALGGGNVIALGIGPGLADGLASCGTFGADKVLHADNADLSAYSGEAFARIVAGQAKALGVQAVLGAATAQGKDLYPRIAAHLETGVVSDCTKLEVVDGKVLVTRPALAGKTVLTVAVEGALVATLRPNTFVATEDGAAASVEAVQAETGSLRDIVKEIVRGASEKLDVAEAEIIVSGGRGLGSPENFEKLIPPIAATLGAAVGASRAVVDAGWRPVGDQVGQTGKTVSPKLYIACGISGAIQHLAGMSSSKCIVAINKDAEAPIFKHADFGIVGDVNEVLPVLAEELKKMLAE